MLQQIVTLHSSHRVYTCVILRTSLISGLIYFSNDSPKQNVAIVFLVQLNNEKRECDRDYFAESLFCKTNDQKAVKYQLIKSCTT